MRESFTSYHDPVFIVYITQHGSDLDRTSLFNSPLQLTCISTFDTGSPVSLFDNADIMTCKIYRLPYIYIFVCKETSQGPESLLHKTNSAVPTLGPLVVLHISVTNRLTTLGSLLHMYQSPPFSYIHQMFCTSY